ncbi:hypothetical protein GAYE_SCF65G6784 [Galdieria yellowstonensis]|uniref:Bacterial surface antigen (D15) domain-containing protein n=1 Tax=Galdieria yellowstonensis TaxID=3028027 RepID=A0AAV9IMU7_9RHOD|nr:hypothetical protein GAYE_SCF65G6784 [Galdieria yellowstonensis]
MKPLESASISFTTCNIQVCYERRKVVCKQAVSSPGRKRRFPLSFRFTTRIFSRSYYDCGSGGDKPPTCHLGDSSFSDPEYFQSVLLAGFPLEDWINQWLKPKRPPDEEGFISKHDEQDRKVRKIIIKDSRVLNRDVVRRVVEPLYGKKLDPVLVKDVIATLNVWYEENGYKFSRIIKSGAFRNGELSFQAIEPSFAGIRLIYLDENREPCKGRTKSDTIEKALGMKRGQVFRWSDVYWERITELGLFDYVRAELELRDDSSVQVVLRVRERPYSRLEPGIGYGSGELFGELSFQDNNLFGRNQYLQFDFQKRQFQHSVLSLEFEDPRVGQLFGYRLKVYRDLDEKHSSSRRGFTVKLFSRLWKHIFVDLSSTLERVAPIGMRDIFQFYFDHNHNYRLGIISSTFTYDDRYPSKNVRSGQRLVIHLADAVPWNEDFTCFWKGSIQFAKYFKLLFGSTLVYGIVGKSASPDLPELEKHRLGGIGSLRGYSTGALGTATCSLQQSVELRFPLFPRVAGVCFYDCLDKTECWWRNPTRLGVSKGIGLRIAETIRLDYAWRQSDGSGMMHIGMLDPFF